MQNSEHKGSLTDKFREFGAAPSEELWQTIAGDLDERKQRRPLIWWWLSGIGAAGVITFLLLLSGQEERQSIHAVSTVEKSSEKATQSSAPKYRPAHKPSTTGFMQKEPLIRILANHAPRISPFTLLPENNHYFAPQKSTVANWAVPENDSTKDKRETVDPLPPLHPQLAMEAGVDLRDTTCYLLTAVPNRIAPERWSVPRAPRWKIGTHFSFANGLGEWVTFDESQPYISAGYDPGIWTAPDNYRSFETTISRRLNRWWLETGIQMGVFKATRPLDTSAFQVVVARTWTIGIPLSARYDIYYQPWTHTQLYVRLGTMHNFPFYRSDTYVADKNSALPSFRTEQKYFNYLGSVSATLGIEQHIWKGLSVDARPEFSFYYKAPTNSYTNPESKVVWWFGWNFGLNWTF